MFEVFVTVVVVSLICYSTYKMGKRLGSRQGYAAGRFRNRH